MFLEDKDREDCTVGVGAVTICNRDDLGDMTERDDDAACVGEPARRGAGMGWAKNNR